MPDVCCEQEFTGGDPDLVRERQQTTTELAWYRWEEVGHRVPWAWVPTIQGWRIPDDYLRHAADLEPLLKGLYYCYRHYCADGDDEGDDSYMERGEEPHDPHDRYAHWRVGIGSLCRRASVREVHLLVRDLSQMLPFARFHLWGVKLSLLQGRCPLPSSVVRADTAAWNGLFGLGIEAWRRSGLSQRRWSLKVALPAYPEKVERTGPTQARNPAVTHIPAPSGSAAPAG